MKILKLLETNEDNLISEKMIHLWEDLIPLIKMEQMHSIVMPKEIILYKYSIKHALSVMGFEEDILYPLMRINGYKTFVDEITSDTLLVPETFNLGDAKDNLLKT